MDWAALEKSALSRPLLPRPDIRYVKGTRAGQRRRRGATSWGHAGLAWPISPKLRSRLCDTLTYQRKHVWISSGSSGPGRMGKLQRQGGFLRERSPRGARLMPAGECASGICNRRESKGYTKNSGRPMSERIGKGWIARTFLHYGRSIASQRDTPIDSGLAVPDQRLGRLAKYAAYGHLLVSAYVLICANRRSRRTCFLGVYRNDIGRAGEIGASKLYIAP